MPPLPCYEVGLDDQANAITSLSQREFVVALVGMGGIGKTTLSKKMYHLFYNQYDKASFLEDVKLTNTMMSKQNFYKICVIESYTWMKMLMNTLMKSNNA
jgi:ABC-type glutathione transport system ATPase component